MYTVRKKLRKIPALAWNILMSAVYTGATIATLAGQAPNLTFTRYPIRATNNTGLARVYGITAGPDGAVWFTEAGNSKIGRITTPSGVITEYPTTNVPYRIVTGPDGALWFTEYDANLIGRITTDGSITEYGPLSDGPFSITPGPDGALWFTEPSHNNKVGRITLQGAVTEFSIPAPVGGAGGLDGITTGPDGAIWFTEPHKGYIGRITTGGVVTECKTPSGGGNLAISITPGPDGALWFTYDGSLGRITTAGAVNTVPVYSPAVATGITVGPDGALWSPEFNDPDTGKPGLKRITTAGASTEYNVPDDPFLDSSSVITTGPDGALWFTDNTGIVRATGFSTGSPAHILSPVPGSTLAGSTITFNWQGLSGADNYWLDVGSSAAQGDISAGSTSGLSKTVSGIPCDGRTIYVQLWALLNGVWQTPQRYTYTASSSCSSAFAQITSPTSGTTLAGPSVTFAWNRILGADLYWLDVGNSVAHGDISAGSTSATSKTVGGLPCDGRTIYVQLWTLVAGAWLTPQRYTYTASTTCN